jgi:UDP:flavonoid glycosyltransferase YjiC (YdhE family)
MRNGGPALNAQDRRVLFAWEFGGGLGHLTRDFPLARICREHGFEVVMAVRDLGTARQALSGEGFTLLQAPVLRPSRMRRPLPINYPDMLLGEGYEDEAALAGALGGWEGIIELARPCCLVFDHAPTALLAARAAGVPALIVGPGFEIPPPGDVAPSFGTSPGVTPEQLRGAEEQWLARVNAVLRRTSTAPLARLADLFPAEAVWLTSFPELDPFGPRPRARYLGPIAALSGARELIWHTRRGPRVFAYLRPSVPRVELLLEALEQLAAEVVCVMPGIPDAWRKRFRKVRCLSDPVDIQTALQGADIAVCHGTLTIAHALLLGRPVLLIPQVVEQFLSGLTLEKLGAGLMLREERSVRACARALGELLEDPKYRQRAQEFSQRYAGYRMEQAAGELFEALAALCAAP